MLDLKISKGARDWSIFRWVLYPGARCTHTSGAVNPIFSACHYCNATGTFLGPRKTLRVIFLTDDAELCILLLSVVFPKGNAAAAASCRSTTPPRLAAKVASAPAAGAAAAASERAAVVLVLANNPNICFREKEGEGWVPERERELGFEQNRCHGGTRNAGNEPTCRKPGGRSISQRRRREGLRREYCRCKTNHWGPVGFATTAVSKVSGYTTCTMSGRTEESRSLIVSEIGSLQKQQEAASCVPMLFETGAQEEPSVE